MPDPFTLAAVASTFLLAGIVKGVIGFGLPTVALALLAATIGLTEAIALMLVPSLVTNLWQAIAGGHGRDVLSRIWPYLLPAALTVWFGALVLTRVDVVYLSALLGLLLIAYAGFGLGRPHLSIAPGREIWLAPLLGAVNGAITGMTGTFVVPGVMYLQALGLQRDALVQAMGMLFFTLTAALAIALHSSSLITTELGALSAISVAPALIGMVLGAALRRRMPEDLFRRIFFLSLLGLGLYILIRALI